jgi:hypothetical protein
MYLKKNILLISLFVVIAAFNIPNPIVQALVKPRVKSNWMLPKKVKNALVAKELNLIILQKNNILTGFLVNNTDTITLINRSDATLYGITTEIFKDGRWQPYQQNLTSWCGNSYWTQALEKRKALFLKFTWNNDKRSIDVPFRVEFNHTNKTIYSNAVLLAIPQADYNAVGKQ